MSRIPAVRAPASPHSPSVARPRHPHAERGLALACALMLLAAAMVIGVAAARGAFALAASARHENDRIVARAAAEAALRDAEHDIAGIPAGGGTGASPARSAQFDAAGGSGFSEGCGSGAADLGLCLPASPPAWQRLDLAADPDELVPYGHFTGAAFPAGPGSQPARAPGYLIEKLAQPGAGPAHGSVYRITAIGFGLRASTQVVLQSIYHKPHPEGPPGAAPSAGPPSDGAGRPEGAGNDGGPPGAADDEKEDGAAADAGARDGEGGSAGPGPPSGPPPPLPPLPAGRIGWREIANWPELHARALQ